MKYWSALSISLLLGAILLITSCEEEEEPRIETTWYEDADGFFIYGRRDYDGSYPTDLDESGGHFGPTTHNPDGEYHYHIQNEAYLGQYCIIFPGDLQGTPNDIQ